MLLFWALFIIGVHGATDSYTQWEWNTRVVCYGHRDRLLLGSSDCVSCFSPWYILMRIASLIIEFGGYYLVSWVFYHLSIYQPTLTHLLFPTISLPGFSLTVMSVFSHSHWIRFRFMNFLTLSYLYPGSWLPVNCLFGNGYDNRLGVNALQALSGLLSMALYAGLVWAWAAWNTSQSKQFSGQQNDDMMDRLGLGRSKPRGSVVKAQAPSAPANLKDMRFVEAYLLFENLKAHLEDIDRKLNKVLINPTAFTALQKDEYITPLYIVHPPFTKANLHQCLTLAFDYNLPRAVQLLEEYERTNNALITIRLVYRLLGVYPIFPFNLHSFWQAIAPTMALMWMVYMPKVLLNMVLTVGCDHTREQLTRRKIYSLECGLTAPNSTAALLIIKLIVALLSVAFIVSFPYILLYELDWIALKEAGERRTISRGMRNRLRDPATVPRDMLTRAPSLSDIRRSTSLGKPLTGEHDDVEVDDVGKYVDMAFPNVNPAENKPVTEFFAQQAIGGKRVGMQRAGTPPPSRPSENAPDTKYTRAHVDGDHRARKHLKPLTEFLLLGYKPTSWIILAAARPIWITLLLISPLAYEQIVTGIGLAIVCLVTIIIVLATCNCHTLRTFKWLGVMDLYAQFTLLAAIVCYDRLRADDSNSVINNSDTADVVTPTAGPSSTGMPDPSKYAPGVKLFMTSIILHFLGLTLAWFAAVMYEWGKVISNVSYRWRSSQRMSEVQWYKDRTGVLKLWDNMCFKFFYAVGQRLETRLMYNPSTCSLLMNRFNAVGKEVADMVDTPNASYAGYYVIDLIEIGLRTLCSGRYACLMQADTVGLLTRYCFECVRHAREIHAETPSLATLRQLLEGIDKTEGIHHPGINDQNIIVENWLGAHQTEVSADARDRSASNDFTNVFRDIYLSPLGAYYHFPWSVSEARWHRLISKRRAIKFVHNIKISTTFSYLEILGTEFAMAIEHLQKITPQLSADLVASFVTASYDTLSQQEDIKKLEAEKTELMGKIRNQMPNIANVWAEDLDALTLEYFDKTSKLKNLKTQCLDLYDACVDSQLKVLEYLGHENEIKLAQAGVNSEIQKEIACIRNVKTEVERSRKPVNILAYLEGDDVDELARNVDLAMEESLPSFDVEEQQVKITAQDSLPFGETTSRSSFIRGPTLKSEEGLELPQETAAAEAKRSGSLGKTGSPDKPASPGETSKVGSPGGPGSPGKGLQDEDARWLDYVPDDQVAEVVEHSLLEIHAPEETVLTLEPISEPNNDKEFDVWEPKT